MEPLSRPQAIIDFCLAPLALDASTEAEREVRRRLEHVIKTYQSKLAVAQARHAADLAVLRGELDRQVSQLADLRAALQRPLTPVLEPVLSKQESGAS